jgi:hypothetical protein
MSREARTLLATDIQRPHDSRGAPQAQAGCRDSACTQRYCYARHSFSDGGADTEFQKVGEGKLVKERKDKAPAVELGLYHMLDTADGYLALNRNPPRASGA